jgi:hypothetical protein
VTNAPKNWVIDWSTGVVASSSSLLVSLAANDHVRHIRLSGTITMVPYPTNVVGDYAVLMGLVATFPAAAPPVPSTANAQSWVAGFWGRPTIDATELMYLTGGGTIPAVRWHWHIDVDYAIDAAGAGGLYFGHQQLFIDPNHQTPLIGFSMNAWGYAP